MKAGKLTEKKTFLAGERWVFVLLGVVMAVFALVLFLGWENSPLSGKIQPEKHVERKVKEELERRFRDGVALLQAKHYDQALTAFHRVLQLNPEMPEAYVNAGFSLLGMGQFKAAADFFDSATTLRPNQLNAYYGLGAALQEMGDKYAALQAMETYLHRSSPSDPFRRKAESAVWELREELGKDRPSVNPDTEQVPHQRSKRADSKP